MIRKLLIPTGVDVTPVFNFSTKKVGLAPGAVVFTGQKKVDEVLVGRIRYGPVGDLQEGPVEDVTSLVMPDGADGSVTWVNVYGLHDADLIKTLCTEHRVHPLAMEDIVSVGIRPVVAEYEDFRFAALKMLSPRPDGSVLSEHVSLATGPGWVLSFQERVGDVFEPLRNRLRTPTTRIRERGSEYLWYALMDAVVDNYIFVVEALSARLEELEVDAWSDEDTPDVPARVKGLREETTVARRAVRPLREQIDSLIKEQPAFLSKEMIPFFGDLSDHLNQLAEALEQIRDSLGSVMDGHLAMVSMRTNDVMKVLTIMASVFIPLTFIAGIYGMNFEYMPELGVRWAYAAVWGVMLAAAAGMLWYFKKKKWI